MRVGLAFAVFVLAVSTVSASHAAMAAPPLPRSVLILNQSTSLRPWPTAIIAGMRSSFRRSSGGAVSSYVEHLDLYQFRSPEYERRLLDHLSNKYRRTPIGVIAAIGPGGLAFAVRLRAYLQPTIPIIFAAVDEKTAASDLPSGVTGTAMDLTLANMMKVAQMIVPDLKQFAIVGDRFEQQLYYHHFAEELPAFAAKFQFIDLMGLPMNQIKQRVAALPSNSVILGLPVASDQATVYGSALEAFEPIAEAANRPIIVDTHVLANSTIGGGAVGGLVLTGEHIGEDAGHLVLRVLNGENASDIPVATGQTTPIFDWRQLQRWNVSESRLPPESEILFRPSTMWEQYRFQVLAAGVALLLQTALILWLISERQRRNLAEAQSRQSLAELTYMNRVASVGLLSASIAHEVNQPLTGIVLTANAALRWLAAGTPNTGKVQQALSQIAESGHRAAEIITSVKAMFRKDDAQEKAPVNINTLIRDVLGLVYIDLRKHSIESRISLGEHLPPVFGNEVQLRQVILNLVMNAIEAMSSAEPRVLSIKSELNGNDSIVVAVEDTGSGIDPSNLGGIFKPLFTTKARGTGMGLSICRSIVESHDGRIWVSPAAPRGSIFHIELPTASEKEILATSISRPQFPGADIDAAMVEAAKP
jgi:signal transduction histidine kinase